LADYQTSNIYDYLVSSTKEQIIDNGLNIDRMTVAVSINAAALPDGERDQIIALAAYSAGVPIENVTVQNFEFAPLPELPEIAAEGLTTLQWIILIAAVLIVLGTIIVVIIISRRRKAQLEAAAAEAEEQHRMSLLELMNQQQTGVEPIELTETTEQKLKQQIHDLAKSDPEIVAQLIKTWLVGTD
jgi:flagellar M-ring protein FliF